MDYQYTIVFTDDAVDIPEISYNGIIYCDNKQVYFSVVHVASVPVRNSYQVK